MEIGYHNIDFEGSKFRGYWDGIGWAFTFHSKDSIFPNHKFLSFHI